MRHIRKIFVKEFDMKNMAKLKAMRSIAGIIAFVAVIGFLFVTCDNGLQQNQYSGGGSGSLNGTYGYTSTGYLTITFRTNGTFSGVQSSGTVNGNYRVSGNTITLSQRYFGYNWTIINSSTIADESGDYWRRR